MTWIKKFPKRTRKSDLVGETLKVTDTPPAPSNVKGMWELQLQKTDGKMVTVLVTTQDIEKIVELTLANGKFTFNTAENKFGEPIAC